jgi:hypothetical protein
MGFGGSTKIPINKPPPVPKASDDAFITAMDAERRRRRMTGGQSANILAGELGNSNTGILSGG